MTTFRKWLLIGMTATAAGRTVWLAMTGEWKQEIGLIVTGAAVSIGGTLLLTVKAHGQ